MTDLPPWRSLITHALHRHRSQAQVRYFQLATVTGAGFPKNRTVVFRGFLEPSHQLKIITDRRSEKISQLQAQPWGEICWYFSKTREQFRLSGTLAMVTAEEEDELLQQARIQTWQSLSDNARSQFAWATPRSPRPDDTIPLASESPNADCPLDPFCLLLFSPTLVDHLQLRGNPQKRTIYTLDSHQQWLQETVYP